MALGAPQGKSQQIPPCVRNLQQGEWHSRWQSRASCQGVKFRAPKGSAAQLVPDISIGGWVHRQTDTTHSSAAALVPEDVFNWKNNNKQWSIFPTAICWALEMNGDDISAYQSTSIALMGRDGQGEVRQSWWVHLQFYFKMLLCFLRRNMFAFLTGQWLVQQVSGHTSIKANQIYKYICDKI